MDSLNKELTKRISKAKQQANALFSNEDAEYKRRSCAFHLGRAAALEEFMKWLITEQQKES